MITIFKNIKETSTPFYIDIGVSLARIKNGSSKDKVKLIRTEKDKTLRNKLKQDLPAICFSGTFTKRADNALQEHSGIICLDFDGFKTKKDILSYKEELSKNRYVFSVFVSPSGNGLKVLVKIPKDHENHVGYFRALEEYFNNPHFDKACKNISRVCYESYDPLIHINHDSSLWTKYEEHEYKPIDKYTSRPTIPINDENKIVERLMAWWTRKYGIVDGERNNNVYILAAAFNDFGVSKSLAEYVMSGFASRDFTRNEIQTTINSAYQKTENFGSKYYEDEEKVFQVRQNLKRGVPKKEIRSQLVDSGIEDIVVSSVISQIEEDEYNIQFWTKSDKGVVNIVHYLFKEFLEDNGFYKFAPEGAKSFIFVKVTNNLIDHTNEEEIKDCVLNYLETIDDLQVYNYFADKTRFFKEDFLSLLSPVDVYFVSDTKDTAYLYYRNCAVKVTKDTKTIIDYIDLGGYVWKDHVIDRDFIMCDVIDCDFRKFVGNIASNIEANIRSLESTIGYLMHGYKNLSYSPAVILNDESVSPNPEGGTGKGLFMNAVGKMKKLVVIDGKSFNFERSFAYQLVSADTQILCFDDVKKHFDFERLFSVVTEGLTLEKKNKDAIKIPFSKSPKIAITTNYVIKGEGSSFERRKFELEFKQHYSQHYTPFMEFKKLFFGDWDENEWCQFDNYMINNLMFYLSEGLIKCNAKNSKIKKLIASTCEEFVQWCGLDDGTGNELLKPNTNLISKDLYNDFIREHYVNTDNRAPSKIAFGRMLVSYGWHVYKKEPYTGRSNVGRIINFIDEKEEKNTKNNEPNIEF